MPGTCFLCGLHNFVHPFPVGAALLPPSTMGESDSLTVFSRPSFRLDRLTCIRQCLGFGYFRFRVSPFVANVRIPCSVSRNHKGLTSSCRFSPHMPRPRTPAAPREPHRKRFLCVAFRRVKNVGNCIAVPNGADLTSGMCESPVAYVVLCVRFAYPPLFACAAVVTACNAPPDAQHSIRVVG